MTELYERLAVCEAQIEIAFTRQDVGLMERLHRQHNAILAEMFGAVR